MQRRAFLTSAGIALTTSVAGAAGAEVLPRAPAGMPAAVATDEDFWAEVTRRFVIKTDAVPLANGAGGQTPQYILDRMAEYQNSEAQWRTKLWLTLKESGSSKDLRTLMAAAYGCDQAEVTLTRNCTDGLATVLFGLDLKPGDEVLTTTQDYDYALDILRQREMRDGIRLVLTQLPDLDGREASDEDYLAAFESRMSPRTRAVVLCHWSAPLEVIHPFCWSADLDGDQRDGKEAQA